MERISIKKQNGKWLVNSKQYPNLSSEEASFFESFIRMMKIDHETEKQSNKTKMKKSFSIMLLLLCSLCFCQKKFVRSENTIHKVNINEDGTALIFDGRTYFIDRKESWFKYHRNDSIIWVYGHNRKKFKDAIKIGFYNNYKNYVISTKTEKLP